MLGLFDYTAPIKLAVGKSVRKLATASQTYAPAPIDTLSDIKAHQQNEQLVTYNDGLPNVAEAVIHGPSSDGPLTILREFEAFPIEALNLVLDGSTYDFLS